MNQKYFIVFTHPNDTYGRVETTFTFTLQEHSQYVPCSSHSTLFVHKNATKKKNPKLTNGIFHISHHVVFTVRPPL